MGVSVGKWCVALAAVATAGLLVAGPLDPPAGPVTGTYKTLTEVEPRTVVNTTNTPGDADSVYKITQPGSYYLAANVVGVAGKHGIKIAVSGVTLDLMGFSVRGVPQSLDGITVTSNIPHTSIINGEVVGWGQDGIDLMGPSNINSGCRIARVTSASNVQFGIRIGPSGIVTDSSICQNIAGGLSAVEGCAISNCSTFLNRGHGISADYGSTILNCSSYANDGSAINANGSTISNCSAHLNGQSGIAGSGCAISGCVAYRNSVSGIGTSTSVAMVISGCSSYDNDGTGISVGSGSTVIGSTARDNKSDGILCDSGCMIRGNSCSNNGLSVAGGAGVHTTGGANRIEGNDCSLSDFGVLISAAGNVIMKNTCSGNGVNWSIVANNSIAPIVYSPVNLVAVSGSSFSGSLGSTDPNANFTY